MDVPPAKSLEPTIETPKLSEFDPLGVTQEISGNSDTVPKRSWANLALRLTSGSQIHSHEQELLRIRLKTAASVLFLGFGFFFVLGLVAPATIGSDALERSLGITTATLGLCAISLRRNCCVNLFRLRVEEGIVFGMPASFLAFLEIHELVGSASHGYLPFPFSAWIVLIFTYALFIPNRFPRAALIIGLMSVVPLVILVLMVRMNDLCRQAENANLSFLLQAAGLMSTAAMIATTGAARIGTLRREALAARELGQYRLKKLIGRGGMGEVYLAEHRLMKRPCAVKLIRPEKAADPRALARFEREVQAASQLTHWNSVYVFDYGHTEDGTFYFVMEFLPGMTLQQLVDRHGPLPPSRAIHFLIQTCAALQEAHDMGLVHRDLKPGNIFAARLGGVDDVAKLLDFGLVTSVDTVDSMEQSMAGMIAGSPHYIAPETATGEREPDARADIYSLGVVAYFLLTGQVPFPGDHPIKVLMAHAHDPAPPLRTWNPSIPEDLEQIVMQCLAKAPENRPQSAAELAGKLCSCAAQGQGPWTRNHARQWWQTQTVCSVAS